MGARTELGGLFNLALMGMALPVGYFTSDQQLLNVAAVGQVAAVHGNYGVGALLNGAVAGLADGSQQAQYSNLIPLGELGYMPLSV